MQVGRLARARSQIGGRLGNTSGAFLGGWGLAALGSRHEAGRLHHSLPPAADEESSSSADSGGQRREPEFRTAQEQTERTWPQRIRRFGAWATAFVRRYRKVGLGLATSVVGGLVVVAIWPYLDGWPRFQPYIAVVVSQEAVDFPIPKEFLDGFQKAAHDGYVLSRDSKRVEIRIREDYGSVEEARRIATVLAQDEECVLVIGNSNSTVTATALDVFLQVPNPPAYVLPIATASNLTAKARHGGHDAVLRMVPDNANQAGIIQELIQSISANQRIAIYVDEENQVYSLDLSREVASNVRRKGGAIVLEQTIGPLNSLFSSGAAWTADSPPEAIVYVGVAHHAFLLIDQVRELQIGVPLIFTDGVMVNQLTQYIARIPNRAFVLSPVGSSRSDGALPTYEPIGNDAFNLAKRLIGDCAGRCARSELRRVVTQVKGQTVLSHGLAGAYEFTSDGNNRGISYKVYEITGGNSRIVSGV